MRKRHFEKEFTIIVLFIFAISGLAFALDGDKTVRVQGLVMELDLGKNTVVVNEKGFIWNEKTVFRNETGVEANDINRLKLNTWVYIVSEYVGMNKYNVAKEIYFLPRYIDEKEKHQYPFIQPYYQRK